MKREWHGCYEGGWKGLIVPEAFAHPAKFSYSLIQRIYRHGLEEGYWRAGDTIGDPFGGVGLGGICAAYAGLNWRGMELEQRFFYLALRNFELHYQKWDSMGDPWPVIYCGDSRRFASLVGCDGIVTSPPFLATDGGCKPLEGKDEGLMQRHSATGNERFGTTPGQIGALPAGSLDGVVTSPPWEKCDQRGSMESKVALHAAAVRDGNGHKGKLGPSVGNDYGSSEGQIGNSAGDTYWTAVAQVYAECKKAMKPGGVMALVLKDYVKGGKRVPLCDQTCQLLESLGFDVFQRCRCWLVKEETHPGLFGDETTKTERKSFFRRLAEKKGSPRIDWEEVIWART